MRAEDEQARAFRFPLAPALVAGLLLVVLLALAHSLYTRHMVADLVAASGELVEDPWPYVTAMFGLTVGLAIFVAVAIAYRASLRLVVSVETLTVERWHWRRRRLVTPLSQVHAVVVAPDARRRWRVRLELGPHTVRLPLADAMADRGSRARAPKNREEAEQHPLVVALRDALGDKVRVER